MDDSNKQQPKFGRDDYLLLARLAQQVERYPEMVEFVSNFFTGDAAGENVAPEQEIEERNIISAAYKNVVGNKRAELRVLTAIEQKETRRNQADNANLVYIRNYKHKIEKELKNYCQSILDTLEKVLIPRTTTLDNKVFYLKMKGDYNRYLSEFLLDTDYNEALQNAKKAYEDADKIARFNLAPTNPIRLGLHLNMSVFLFEILSDPIAATKLAEAAFEDAIQNIDNVNEEQYKDCTLIMQLLRDNMTLWQDAVNKEDGYD